MLPNDHIAIFADIPLLSERQRTTALNVAKELNAKYVVAELCWDRLPGVRENTEERCYHCKRAIYHAVTRIGYDSCFTIFADGENASDDPNERPGRKAAKEFKIVSPLKDLGFSRDIVKKMFSDLHLRTDVQKETCLATRFPYNVTLNDAELRIAEECEELIREISGVKLIRMRVNGKNAKLLALPSEIALLIAEEEKLRSALRSKGLLDVTIDKIGYRE
jgi:uncharacterized protein